MFNEPAEELKARTHLVRLAEETIEANARFFTSRDEVPEHAITTGMGTILSSRKILLLAQGESKAAIIRQLFESDITTNIPASFLRLHQDVTVLVDKAAASLVPKHILELK